MKQREIKRSKNRDKMSKGSPVNRLQIMGSLSPVLMKMHSSLQRLAVEELASGLSDVDILYHGDGNLLVQCFCVQGSACL